MIEPGLKETLERLALTQAELARLVNVSTRAVSLWATGDTPLPGPVSAYLRVLQKLPPDALKTELARLHGRAKMFDEGVYALDYSTSTTDPSDSIGTALAVLRNGKILGSDRRGGVFTGSYEYDTVQATNRVHVRMKIPPDGELVTGFAAGPAGAVLDIVADFDRPAPVAAATIEVGGRPVEVKFKYLGPLPN